jgi:hypothetical protein
MEATQSLLTSNTTGGTFLAVKQTGEHSWNLCAIDVNRGRLRWCSSLAQRADIALSAIADKALVHAPSGDLSAYEIETGRLAWRLKLDCAISPGHLRAVGEGLALATCEREGTAEVDPAKPSLVAIGVDDGKVRWQRAQDTRYSRLYLHEGFLLVAPERGLVWSERPRIPPRRLIDQRHSRGGWVLHKALGNDGGNDDEWTVLDVKTGRGLPASVLAHEVRGQEEGGSADVVASAVFSDDVAILELSKDARKIRLAAANSEWRCLSDLHDPWGWLHEHLRVLHGGRLFAAGCDDVSEIDPATGKLHQSWPMAGGEELFAPLLMALGVAGSRVTFVVGSRDDQETGRVVTFDGATLASASRAPVLDPDLLALMGNVLVVQERVHPSGPDDSPPTGARRKPVLAGYSIADTRVEDLDEDRANTDRIRNLIAHLGTADLSLCSQCESMLDAKSMATLKAIPRWEALISALLLDHSSSTREAAFAAVKQVRSPALLQELIRLLETRPTHSWNPWNQEGGWWMAIGERQDRARMQAAMALIELRHLPAVKPLTRLFLDVSQYDPHDPVTTREFPLSFCSWIGGSNLPEAKAAIEDYDRSMNAPGAWQARCEEGTRQPHLRHHRAMEK